MKRHNECIVNGSLLNSGIEKKYDSFVDRTNKLVNNNIKELERLLNTALQNNDDAEYADIIKTGYKAATDLLLLNQKYNAGVGKNIIITMSTLRKIFITAGKFCASENKIKE